MVLIKTIWCITKRFDFLILFMKNHLWIANVKCSRLQMLCKMHFLKKFAKFTGKHLSPSLFFNKVADLHPATLLTMRYQHWGFPVNFAKTLKTPFLHKNSGRVLLYCQDQNITESNETIWSWSSKLKAESVFLDNYISLKYVCTPYILI